jgi:trafficking protein particle complex subunit 3
MTSKGTNNNSSLNALQIGTILWQKQSKCNAEFFALTYGSLIAELLRDIEDPILITNELDRMGHSIGIRCIEEVLAKISSLSIQQQQQIAAQQQQSLPTSSSITTGSYKTFLETSDLIQTTFRMFLGITSEAKVMSDTSYTISFTDNPLAIFVELPPSLSISSSSSTTMNQQQSSSSSSSTSNFEYSQLFIGMIRGMLEMLQYDVSCHFTNTTLSSGNDATSTTNDILVELKQILQDGAGDDYHEE